MLSISPAASADYYTKTAQEVYLSAGGSSRVEWLGKGAGKLGLNDTMDREPFLNLYAGFSPDGSRPLVQNAGHENRQAGWDLTFSAPKSFSVVWAVASEQTREKLLCAHREAVKEAFEKIEQELAFTRRGPQGRRTESVSLVGRTYEHATSRAAEPQIHTHLFVFNIGLRADGTTGTILSKPFFDAKLELGKFYRDALARHLNRDLGLTMIEHEIAGVPKSLCNAFSTRRHEIEMVMEKTGDTSAKAAERAALATRKPKVRNSRDELFASWKTTALQHGFGKEQAEQLFRSPTRVTNSTDRARTKEVRPSVQAVIAPTPISNPVLTAKDIVEGLKLMAKLAPEKSKANDSKPRDEWQLTALEAAKRSRALR